MHHWQKTSAQHSFDLFANQILQKTVWKQTLTAQVLMPLSYQARDTVASSCHTQNQTHVNACSSTEAVHACDGFAVCRLRDSLHNGIAPIHESHLLSFIQQLHIFCVQPYFLQSFSQAGSYSCQASLTIWHGHSTAFNQDAHLSFALLTQENAAIWQRHLIQHVYI